MHKECRGVKGMRERAGEEGGTVQAAAPATKLRRQGRCRGVWGAAGGAGGGARGHRVSSSVLGGGGAGHGWWRDHSALRQRNKSCRKWTKATAVPWRGKRGMRWEGRGSAECRRLSWRELVFFFTGWGARGWVDGWVATGGLERRGACGARAAPRGGAGGRDGAAAGPGGQCTKAVTMGDR